MASPEATSPFHDASLTGTAREFAEYCYGERLRRNNADETFDPALFDAAVAYILEQLTTRAPGSRT